MFSKLQAKLCKRLRFVKVMVTTLNFNALRTQPHFRYHDILVRANSLPSNRESIAPPFLFYAMDLFSPIMRGCEDSRSWNQRSVRFKLRSFTPPLITCLPPISSLSRAWRRELHCLVPKALHVLASALQRVQRCFELFEVVQDLQLQPRFRRHEIGT